MTMPHVTHTYATLELSQSAFDEIKAKLEAAGYQDQFHKDGDALLIDMHGIAVHGDGKPSAAKVNRRMVCNIALQHFGDSAEINNIVADAEAGRITDVQAIRAIMEFHLKMAKDWKPSPFSQMINVNGGELPNRRDGHSALRVKDGAIETFDVHGSDKK